MVCGGREGVVCGRREGVVCGGREGVRIHVLMRDAEGRKKQAR